MLNKLRLFFVGHPCSGHNIVGSILDAHPHIILAHEAKLFLKLQQDISYNKGLQYKDKLSICNELWNNSYSSSTSGLCTKNEMAFKRVTLFP